MARSKTQIELIDEESKNVFVMWMSIMNDFTGGAFLKGYRPAMTHDRIKEWDSLTPDQLEQLRTTKGDEWVLKQGVEIDRLRRETEKVME